MKFQELISMSRPRFWMYLAGPYLVGAAVAPYYLLTYQFWLYFLFFLLPANFFLYGINDYCDRDTDAHNAKKGSKEYKHTQKNESFLKGILCMLAALNFTIAFTQPSTKSGFLLLLFLFLSYGYSSLPLRFKARPFVDSLSNVLYVIPGFIGYFHASGQLPPLWAVVGAWAWAASMHLFSAIPDIMSDKKARLKTTAIVLGHEGSLVACTILWLVATLTLVYSQNYLLLVVGVIYVMIPLKLVHKEAAKVERIYWMFPYLNAITGAVLFFSILF